VKKVIGYRRASTQRQGRSGLGLEAQQAAIEAFCKPQGAALVATYTEVETGKKNGISNRPQLRKALAHARMMGATLVIGKLDRLARNVAFLSALMEAGVDFNALDCPHADPFTLHILAAVAEKEARDISARTKAALAAYKARGGVLGSARPECAGNLSPEAMAKGRQLAAVARHEKAVAAYADLVPVMREMRDRGMTYRAIAGELTAQGYTTRRGKVWNHIQVRLVLERAE